MKEPERLFGFVKYNDEDYPFLYESGVLTLLPKDRKKWSADKHEDLISFLNRTERLNREEWVGELRLHGITKNEKSVMFCVSDQHSTDNGYRMFSVNYLVEYHSDTTLSDIKRMRLESEEIDNYSPASRSLSCNVETNKEMNSLTSVSVKCESQENIKWGKCNLKGIEADISIQTLGELKTNSNMPLYTHNEMIIDFDNEVEIDSVLDSVECLMHFFCYVTYRHNIDRFKITLDLVKEGEENQLFYTGELFWIELNEYEAEHQKSKKNRIIKSEYLNGYEKDILQAISKNEIYFDHMCKSISDTQIFNMSRQVLIFTAFDREFLSLYGQDYNRSPEYIETKKDVADMIKSYCEDVTGSKRKYATSLLRLIERHDNSLKERIKIALYDCKDIVELIIMKLYNRQSDEIDGTIEDIAERMNEVRNNITHGNLSFGIEPIHLTDYGIMQALLYAMRLNKIGLDSEIARKAIRELLNI